MARIALVDELCRTVGHAVREFVSNYIERDCEAIKERTIAIAEDHLLAVPEGIVIVLVEVNKKMPWISMLSAAVMSPSRLGSWNTMPKRLRTSLELRMGSSPSISKVPLVGRLPRCSSPQFSREPNWHYVDRHYRHQYPHQPESYWPPCLAPGRVAGLRFVVPDEVVAEVTQPEQTPNS